MFCNLWIFLIWSASSSQVIRAWDRHPLDPLTEEEVTLSSSIIQREKGSNWRFMFVGLQEPKKATLLPYFLNGTEPPSSAAPRNSFSILMGKTTPDIFEAVVNLEGGGRLESWTRVRKGLAAGLTLGDEEIIHKIVREDVGVQQRCASVGWANMSLVSIRPWIYSGHFQSPPKSRLFFAILYGLNFLGDNENAHPFPFWPILDVVQGRVIRIDSIPTNDVDGGGGKGPVPTATTVNYLQREQSYPSREELKVVYPSQNGTSWKVSDGNRVRWQKFDFRVGFNIREGLVIHHVRYNDSGTLRPLFYRMSLAEMVTSYGNPRPPLSTLQVLDAGQYGLGQTVNTLLDQVDCMGNVHYFDAVFADDAGGPRKVPHVACLHEEDAGVLWKKTEYRAERVRTGIARSQRLALTSMSTIGGYDYIFTWNFYQDARIKMNIRLTGKLLVALADEGITKLDHGSIVAPQINAHFHQHFFSLRLDPELDGSLNSVAMSDVVEKDNGGGFTTKITKLSTAAAARTKVNPASSRVWLITNPNSSHPATKGPVGWKLVPWASPALFVKSPVTRWLQYDTWVTRYDDNQRYPSGQYENDKGLAEWVEEEPNASVEAEDIVLWHSFGITHIPRAEDYPSMPEESVVINLKPCNFFKGNPALDVPPPVKYHQQT